MQQSAPKFYIAKKKSCATICLSCRATTISAKSRRHRLCGQRRYPTVEAVYGTEVAYGLRFADVRLSLPVPGSQAVEFDIKILLDSLASPEAGISQEAWNALYYGLMGDNGPYADRAVDARLRALRTDPYWTALHVKYAYAVTCHKAQGGQWSDVYVDLSYIPEDALNLGLYRWLYTAVTRSEAYAISDSSA